MADDPRRGECRQQPPQVLPIVQKMDAATGTITLVGANASFPTTFADWDCGQHKVKLEVV